MPIQVAFPVLVRGAGFPIDPGLPSAVLGSGLMASGLLPRGAQWLLPRAGVDAQLPAVPSQDALCGGDIPSAFPRLGSGGVRK